jgi:hypothetical protein
MRSSPPIEQNSVLQRMADRHGWAFAALFLEYRAGIRYAGDLAGTPLWVRPRDVKCC